MAKHGGFWNEENVEELKRLVSEGMSYGRIARALGCVTRNQPLCKANRLGLVHPHGNDKSDIKKPRLPYISKEPYVPAVKPVQAMALPLNLPALMLEDGSCVTLETLTSQMCNYPLGDPLGKDFQYCGRAKKLGSAYCDVHHALCRVPAPRRVKVDHRGKQRA
jgi:GcrA cell cycle regulator